MRTSLAALANAPGAPGVRFGVGGLQTVAGGAGGFIRPAPGDVPLKPRKALAFPPRVADTAICAVPPGSPHRDSRPSLEPLRGERVPAKQYQAAILSAQAEGASPITGLDACATVARPRTTGLMF